MLDPLTEQSYGKIQLILAALETSRPACDVLEFREPVCAGEFGATGCRWGEGSTQHPVVPNRSRGTPTTSPGAERGTSSAGLDERGGALDLGATLALRTRRFQPNGTQIPRSQR